MGDGEKWMLFPFAVPVSCSFNVSAITSLHVLMYRSSCSPLHCVFDFTDSSILYMLEISMSDLPTSALEVPPLESVKIFILIMYQN